MKTEGSRIGSLSCTCTESHLQFFPYSLQCLTECPSLLPEPDGILQFVDALLRQSGELHQFGLGEVTVNEDSHECGTSVHTFFPVGVEKRFFLHSVMAAYGCHHLAVFAKNNLSHKNNSLSSVVVGNEPHIN